MDTGLSEAFSRADLHVHSKYSDQPAQWFLRRIGVPECFTPPLALYEVARRRGMDFVTITDHDDIRGALEIAHLPGAFISEEITAVFPENGCKMHVLAWDITPGQHAEIQRLRQNIYDLLTYLRQEDVLFALAHPLYANNNQLTPDLVEKCLLLFKVLELRNGHHTTQKYRLLEELLAQLSPEMIADLSEKHGLVPAGDQPWVKFITGGSDDHGALSIATTYTQTPRAATVREFLQHIRNGRSTAQGEFATSMKLAHAIFSVSFNYYASRLAVDGRTSSSLITSFFDQLLEQRPARRRRYLRPIRHVVHHLVYKIRNRRGVADRTPISAIVKHEAIEYLRHNPQVRKRLFSAGGCTDQALMLEFASQVSSRVVFEYTNRLLRHVRRGNVFQVFSDISALAAIHFVLAPYFVAFGHDNKDRRLLIQLQQRFALRGASEPRRVLVLFDLFQENNGVVRFVEFLRHEAQQRGQHLVVATCRERPQDEKDTLICFPSVGRASQFGHHELPLAFPPLLDVMRLLETGKFDAVHVATPGPMGLIGLALAKLYKLPIVGTYHTDFPRYIRFHTGEQRIEELAWKYLRWFYGRVERILVPSRVAYEALVQNGFDAERIELVSRGVDTEAFSPARRDEDLWRRMNVDGERKLLYVGRISREMNVDGLVDNFRRIHSRCGNVLLVLVGDGPYRAELEQRCVGMPVLFLGSLRGDRLAQVYASSDLFVFPAATDTLDNVVLEAQASGLPAVVADVGGPSEVIVDGKTGRVFSAQSETALGDVVCELLSQPAQLREMGRCARLHADRLAQTDAFQRWWGIHEAVIAADRAASCVEPEETL